MGETVTKGFSILVMSTKSYLLKLLLFAFAGIQLAGTSHAQSFVRILSQPGSVQANLGMTVSLAVEASNATTYQWYKDGNRLDWATGATLVLTNIQPPRIGDYRAVVGNALGSVTSSVATLAITGQNAGIWKGLVGYYPFDGRLGDQSTFRVGSAVFHGVDFGRDRFGDPDGAVAFATDRMSYVDLGTDVAANVSNDLTQSIWIRVSGPMPASKHVVLLSRFTRGTAGWVTVEFNPTGKLSAEITNPFYLNPTMVEIDPSAVADGQWHQLVVTRSGSRIGLFVDGDLRAAGMDAALFSPNTDRSPFWIGRNYWADYAPGETTFFPGSVDDFRLYDRALSDAEVKALYEYESLPSNSNPRMATGIAQVVNGFVVGASVTDGGLGYTNAPMVTISGGGGSGATARATVVNGVVTAITIQNPGSGYSSAPTLTIAPPPFPPRKATAIAQIVNGFVVGANLTDGGFGYQESPAVVLTGGGGTGAKAIATVVNGVVTAVTITTPGTGYTSAPSLRIASPPFSPSLSVEVSRVKVGLKVVLGRKYQIESTSDMVSWSPTGPAFVAEDEELIQEFPVDTVGRFFRIHQVP